MSDSTSANSTRSHLHSADNHREAHPHVKSASCSTWKPKLFFMNAWDWRSITLVSGVTASVLLMACWVQTSPEQSVPVTRPPGPAESNPVGVATPSVETVATTTEPTGTTSAPTEPSPTPTDLVATSTGLTPIVADISATPTESVVPITDTAPAVTATVPTATTHPVAIEPAFPGLPPLKLPVALVDVPKYDLYLIALQDGLVLAVPREGPYEYPRTVYDQRERTLRYGYEEGFLTLSLDPDFDKNGYVYAYYSYSAETDKRSTRLVRFETTSTGDTFEFVGESEFVILEIPQPDWNHNGGSLLFGPDGMLYLGIGDGGGDGDPDDNGQNPGTLLGTVIRIDVRNVSAAEPYGIPPDNPMVSLEGPRPEVWAYGLRNPWRLSFDRDTGLLWGGDVGHYHAEEINVIRPGENYGWSITEGSSCFPLDEVCDLTSITLPVWEYGRSFGCAIIGGYVYRGKAIPSLVGWYVYADYCSRHVRAIHADTAAAGEAVEPIPLFEDGPRSIFSLAEDSAGEIYLLTGDEDSEESVYRLVPR